MKKSFPGEVIGLFLFSAVFFAVRTLRLSAAGGTAGGNGAVVISKAARSTPTAVGSLPGALQNLLSQTIGANDSRYRVTHSGGGYRAVNGRNCLRATIGLGGFMVRAGANVWGLRLTAWGRGRRLQKIEAGRAVSASNRVDIRRTPQPLETAGTILARLALSTRTLPPGYTISRPAGSILFQPRRRASGFMTLNGTARAAGGGRAARFSHGSTAQPRMSGSTSMQVIQRPLQDGFSPPGEKLQRIERGQR